MSYALDRLMKNAQIALPGSLDNVIRLELFNVLDSFFRNTSIWTEDIPFSVSSTDLAGTVYYIEPESVSVIVRLLNVTDVNDFIQRPVMMPIPGEIILGTPPSQNGTLTALVCLSIVDPIQRDGYPEFPEWVLTKYGIGILDGILARMMSQPAKPYTNLQLAAVHMHGYRKTLSIASAEAVHGNLQNGQRWRFPQQFSTYMSRRR